MRRLPIQISIRQILTLVTVCAIACGIFAVAREHAIRQVRLRHDIHVLGGSVGYTYFDGPDRESETSDWVVFDRRNWVGIKWITLEGPRVGDAEMQILRRTPSVRDVCISNTHVSDVGLSELAHCCNVEVLIFRTDRRQRISTEFVGGMSRLRHATLDNVVVSRSDIENLSRCTSIEGVSLEATQLSLYALSALQQLPHLNNLNLASAEIESSSHDWKWMRRLDHLETLDLSWCKAAMGVLPHLGGCARLRQLAVSGCPIHNSDLRFIAACKSLEWLDLSCTEITDEALDSLRHCPKLSYINLNGCDLVSDSAKDVLRASKPLLTDFIGD